ncbi:DUF21-domain-containing protein [Dacryopinax primogenitus]|uniref:DUF21-domain-containing protein n=1 Tax=Dacryopinax primogenitus (strain DJM 731) TaxID=1858805 RepID=M5FUE0_DACPD|nr:DUF21-domain-containing protein [Dacryopinax primogenitus]EJT99094.1 DUF21-domain-containing protein [Dacryopinax primogenitus]
MYLPTVVHVSRAGIHLALQTRHAHGNSPVFDDPSDHEEWGSPEFYGKLLVSLCLVLAGGVFAGLTLGLMGLDELHLRVLATSSDDPVEKANAEKVRRLLHNKKHWVLVVLLLSNVVVNESLPIFLDDAIGGGFWAIGISTTLIVIFGEIIPQAVCARYGLSIGAKCVWFVWLLMWIFAPIAWPIAKLLDHVLGEDEEHTYKKAELKSFLQLHKSGAEPLRDDEISILNGVLSLNEKVVLDIMTPIDDVSVISYDKILDNETVEQLIASGYSRFPVHEPGRERSFIGLLLIKRLIAYDPDDSLPVSAFPLSVLPEAKASINCFQALDYFQTGRAHLLLITEHPGKPYGALGVITLEDIIEEMINEEIVDETDLYTDNHTRQAVKRRGNAAVMRGIIEQGRRIAKDSRATSSDSDARNLSLSRGPTLEPTAHAAGETTRLLTIVESATYGRTNGTQNGNNAKDATIVEDGKDGHDAKPEPNGKGKDGKLKDGQDSAAGNAPPS